MAFGIGTVSPFGLGGPGATGGNLGMLGLGLGLGMAMAHDGVALSPEAQEGGFGQNNQAQLMELALLLALLMEMMSGGGASPLGGMPGGGFPMGGGFPGGGFPGGGFPGGAPMGIPGGFPGGAGHGRGHGAPASGGTGGGSAPSNVHTPTGPVTPKVQNFMNIATAQSGKPYVMGAEGPNAFDCSGLVDYALNKAGVKVPRLTADGYMNRFAGSTVSKDQLKPGDLLYFYYPQDGTAPGHASHIEIYLGNGKSMGAHDPKDGCGVGNVNWKALIRAERVPQLYQ